MSVAVAANPVNWFEIPVVDMERAKKFYSAVFDSEFTDVPLGEGQMAWFPMGQGLPGAAGTLMKHPEYVPSLNGPLIYFSVADVADSAAKVKEAGGKVCLEKMSIGEYGYIAIFVDSEGNRLGLHSRA